MLKKYRITNRRRGSYTVLRPGKRSFNIESMRAVVVRLTEGEAANAEYPGVTVDPIPEAPGAD